MALDLLNTLPPEGAFGKLDQQGLSAETHKVALAGALLWSYFTRNDLHKLLPVLAFKPSAGRNFTLEQVKTAFDELMGKQLLEEHVQRPGYFQLADTLRIALYRQWFELMEGRELVDLICRFYGFDLQRLRHYSFSGNQTSAIALLRAMLLAGSSREELTPVVNLIKQGGDWGELAAYAVLLPFDADSFQRVDLYWQNDLASRATVLVCKFWSSKLLPVVDWAKAQSTTQPASLVSYLRLALADFAVQCGDSAVLEKALAGIDVAACDALRAAALIADGQWASGQQAFEAALKRGQAEMGVRKQVFPESIAWFYPLALLAQGGPKHLELARKFCVGEAGTRTPSAHDDWGRWVNAIDARLGNAPLVASAFVLHKSGYERHTLALFWKLMLAAWVGPEALGKVKEDDKKAFLDNLRCRLQDCGFTRLLGMLDGAEAVLAGGDPPAGFFVAGKGERWREVLGALQELAGETVPGVKAKDGADKTRILWTLCIGKQGELLAIKPFEQKRGRSGWSTPKALPLSRLAADQALSPGDVKLARCLRAERNYAKRFNFDLANAIVALVGHPAVALDSAPALLVDLVETPPEFEVVRQGDKIVMQINPPLRTEPGDSYYYDAEEKRDAEALRLITLLPDGPQRVRLVRYTVAQRRAAQLVSGRFAVPANAEGVQAELDKTLQALAGHFQVQADAAQASRQVACESRLRAELAPVGESLSLRLVAAPLGADGPRLPVGSGRVRLMAAIGGETLGTERQLATEKKHLEAVLDAFPFLDDAESSEWLIDDPELALGLVEALPGLAAIAAVDWPKGKSVRVISIDAGKLGITVSKERDWFRVSGQAGLDEGLVVQLETLLAAARDKSRFIPMGDGVYAALTRALKQKLLDLAAVAEVDKHGSKVPQIAAAWLDEVLDGTELSAGSDFRKAIERLRAAQALVPKLPKSLQADLRPYQEEGYQWAMRLAAAGLGGCLADDMGLGKTLQALAVMLERAKGGPALVIAPTSVCGNWLAEALRFAPSLNARIYSEASDAEREQLIDNAGAQDVLIVSYTLLQLAQERFAGRQWHTLVADEAQAIKNATAKRSQAVFDLPADFRLALSGTPVENRLAELWSIMRFVNPGLLGTIGRFNERFAGPIERNRDRDAQHVLKRLIGPFVMRRTKGQVLQDLPPRTELILSVTPEAAEAAHYEALRRQAISDVSMLNDSGAQAGQARFNILAQLTKLRRAACDPRLASPEFGIAGAKVQAFAELAAELTANGHKTLVFSQFVDFLQILRAPLDAAGISYQYLDGATPAAERSKRVAAFQAGESDLFLISLKAGGFGLNLTAADYVVITDPWWNPAAEDQAMGRAHRIGQLRPVTVYRLVSKGSIEERIVDLHHDKRALADSILDDGDASALPSTEDLVALIRGE